MTTWPDWTSTCLLRSRNKRIRDHEQSSTTSTREWLHIARHFASFSAARRSSHVAGAHRGLIFPTAAPAFLELLPQPVRWIHPDQRTASGHRRIGERFDAGIRETPHHTTR